MAQDKSRDAIEQFLESMRKDTAYWNKAVREYNIRMD